MSCVQALQYVATLWLTVKTELISRDLFYEKSGVKPLKPWTQDVNSTYIRRSEDVLDILRTSSVHIDLMYGSKCVIISGHCSRYMQGNISLNYCIQNVTRKFINECPIHVLYTGVKENISLHIAREMILNDNGFRSKH